MIKEYHLRFVQLYGVERSLFILNAAPSNPGTSLILTSILSTLFIIDSWASYSWLNRSTADELYACFDIAELDSKAMLHAMRESKKYNMTTSKQTLGYKDKILAIHKHWSPPSLLYKLTFGFEIRVCLKLETKQILLDFTLFQYCL